MTTGPGLALPGDWEGGQSPPHQGPPSARGGEDTHAVTRCCCAHKWEESPEGSDTPSWDKLHCGRARERCLLSPKSMVLSALLQPIYS